ncbi:linoleate diol synthase [Marasmius fiardii PR-910]|nr:linoleate diol synthase [Marasmius fiardii PR-910]
MSTVVRMSSAIFKRGNRGASSTDGVSSDESKVAGSSATAEGKMLKDTTKQVKKGGTVHSSHSALSAVLDAVRHSESIDDRKLLLEHGLALLSKLPPGKIQQDLQDRVIKLLYNDLSHPPATYIGNDYAWRSADGSFNNVAISELGRAGKPYARSVQQSHPLAAHELPDPGLIFDSLLKREGFVKHPAGLSSLMFSFAALVIHTVFRTSHVDVNINETSSYLDLSPLYGHNQEAQDKVRARDGRGHLYPDVFAEDRLLLLPPAVCVILVLFSRNHNYIADRLLEINERKTFRDPSKIKDEKALADQDDELFQTAKLVNCGWFSSAILSDYVSCILGLVRQGSNWALDPFRNIWNEGHSQLERGKGNACSVEFNCLYRWHATTSVDDEKWVNNVFEKIFDGKDPEQVTPEDFKAAAKKLQAMNPDIQHWTFGGLQRGEDGRFKDEDLANVLKTATDHPAGAFRARGTPASMRLHEMMGIMQNRTWGVCSLNDFRRSLGLKPYASFLEWNPDPEIAHAAEKLYGNIEYLELYVGLQAEEAKPVVEGAGLCPGYTISRAILSDAVSLTRGDRHFTHNFTPFNLTAWGFADCVRDPGAWGFGSTLGRLFLRTLPNQFSENSTYAFFPLMTPDSMKGYLKDLKCSDKYDLTRSGSFPSYQPVKDYRQIGDILKSNSFKTPRYQDRAGRVIKGKGFFTVSDKPEEQERVSNILSLPESQTETAQYFHKQTLKLIKENSWGLSGSTKRAVDIVRDVCKAVPAYWAAEIAGITLKNDSSGSGSFTVTEFYDMLGEIYTYIFLNVEASQVMVLQEKVEGHVQKLLDAIESGLHLGLKRLSISSILDRIISFFSRAKPNEQHVLVKKLQEQGNSPNRIAVTVLAIMVGTVPELSLVLTNMINLLLNTSMEETVRTQVNSGFENFAKESLRLDPPFRGVFRVASADTASAKKGTELFLDLATACQDFKIYPNPDSFEPTRPNTHHLFTDDGIYRCLGEKLTEQIMGQVLKAIFSLKNIERGPDQSGKLKRFKDHTRPELNWAYLDDAKKVSAWPTSLHILYDP